MGRFIVMDIVFHGNSLNYDQGGSNYQELKKITKWDGKQYTFVSRYALRYSILETGREFGYWKLAEGNELKKEKGKNEAKGKEVIQPNKSLLFNGKILDYPEFDLFGYLITSTKPQNFREAPVKISHAISMTPFSYDALFNANVGLANRLRKTVGDMNPNPFTSEEHFAYYQYSVVIDVDRIGKIEVYYKLEGKNKKEEIFYVDENYKNKIELKQYSRKDDTLFIGTFSLKDEEEIKKRIKNLIKVILNLKRSIKGRLEDLSPKVLVLGVYKDSPYKTYKDKISLVDEYTEEEYDEIEEIKDKNAVRVRHIIRKSKKPVFEISDFPENNKEKLNEEEILSIVEELFKEKNNETEEENKLEKIKLFYSPEVEIRIK